MPTAGGLAGRLDALPTRLFTVPAPARTSAAIRELAQIHLISQALPARVGASRVTSLDPHASAVANTEVLRTSVTGEKRKFGSSLIKPEFVLGILQM